MSRYPNTSPESQDEGTINLREGINADVQRVRQTPLTDLSHAEMMARLCNQVMRVNFRERAEMDPDDEDVKLKTRHYLIIVVEELLELAKRNKWALCRNLHFIYAYNGTHWRVVSEDNLKAFLRQVAERMGVDKYQARYVGFSNQLYEQFTATGYLPAPERNTGSVKINLANGTFEISTDRQHLRPPDPADFLTHRLPFVYDPKATAPRWKAFLDRVQPDPACQQILAEYIGYVFVSPSKLKLEKTLLLYGSGANGKSVFFEVITALLGPDNVSHYSLQSLTNEPAYCRANLANKLVNYASEINGKLEADTFKQLVSGEPIEARQIRQEPFIMTEYAKLIFNCNELPTDVEHTPAYFRRFLIVPFGVMIPQAERDPKLAAHIIEAELSGVFNWVLDGLRRLLKQGGFTDSEAVRNQLDLYKRHSDSVRLFLDEQDYQASDKAYTALKELYREYKVFCVEDGYRAVNNKNFKKRLEGYGLQTDRRNIGQVVFVTRPGSEF